jgi:hypothetical protein
LHVVFLAPVSLVVEETSQLLPLVPGYTWQSFSSIWHRWTWNNYFSNSCSHGTWHTVYAEKLLLSGLTIIYIFLRQFNWQEWPKLWHIIEIKTCSHLLNDEYSKYYNHNPSRYVAPSFTYWLTLVLHIREVLGFNSASRTGTLTEVHCAIPDWLQNTVPNSISSVVCIFIATECVLTSCCVAVNTSTAILWLQNSDF